MAPRTPCENGFVILNKDIDWSSFDAVARMRTLLKIKKIGHGGTLDPAASGVLVLCCGKTTRLSKYLLHSDKEYRATVRLGQATETYDSEGEPVGEYQEPPEMDAARWQQLLEKFTGEIEQTPPLYSAKKVQGKRLYEYAREGKKITPKPQTVTIYSIDVRQFDRERIVLDIRCGSGMYVRSLADDIGKELGCGAYLDQLVRTKAGSFTIEESFSIADVEAMIGDEDFSFFRPPSELLPGMIAITANPGQKKRFVNGNFIVVHNPLYKHRQELQVMDEQGNLLGIGEVEKPLGSEMVNIHPRVVIQ